MFGGPGEVRTLDLMTASHARSQLRHRPTVALARVESILPYWTWAGKASYLASVSGNDLIRSLLRRNTNGQGTPLKRLSVQACDCPLSIFAIAKFDKTEPAWRPSHIVSDHRCGSYLKAR